MLIETIKTSLYVIIATLIPTLLLKLYNKKATLSLKEHKTAKTNDKLVGGPYRILPESSFVTIDNREKMDEKAEYKEGEIVGNGILTRAPQKHKCSTPDKKEQSFHKIRTRDIWECGECNKKWIFQKPYWEEYVPGDDYDDDD